MNIISAEFIKVKQSVVRHSTPIIIDKFVAVISFINSTLKTNEKLNIYLLHPSWYT